jgi:hypothetical protein
VNTEKVVVLRSDVPMITKTIEVYVCPDPECPSYYGSNGMPVLESQWTGPKVEDRAALKATTGSPERKNRAECPLNPAHGQRVLARAVVRVPAEKVENPPLPA